MKWFKLLLTVACIAALAVILPILSSAEDWDFEVIPGSVVDETFELDSAPVTDVPVPLADSAVELPDSIDLSQDKYFPPIRNQSGSSCVSWAIVYYQFTYQVARMNDWDAKHNDDYVFSPRYIYNYLNGGGNNSTRSDYTYQLLSELGSVRFNEFQPTWTGGAEHQEWYADVQDRLDAMKTVVSSYSYHRLGAQNDPTPITSPKDSDLEHIKSLLNSGHLVSFGMNYTNFYYRPLPNEQRLYCFATDNSLADAQVRRYGHQLTIVGYDDDFWHDVNKNGEVDDFEKGAFIFANSWGANWCNGGFAYLLYDALNPVSASDYINNAKENRIPVFSGNLYSTIEVENRDVTLVAAVTVNQRYRDTIKLFTSTSLYGPFQQTKLTWIANDEGKGGHKSYNGVDETAQDYTYLVDFSKYSDGMPRGGDYFITVSDSAEGDDTIIKSIKWLDVKGRTLEQSTEASTIVSKGSKSLSYTWVPVTGVRIIGSDGNNTNYSGYTLMLSAEVYPPNASCKDVIWGNDQTGVIIIPNEESGYCTVKCLGGSLFGKVKVTTVDGNFSADCLFFEPDDHSNCRYMATQLYVNTPVTGEIDYKEDRDYFLAGLEPGTYTLYVEGMENAVLTLRSSSGSVLATAECVDEANHIYSITFTLDEFEFCYVSVEREDSRNGEVYDYTLYLISEEAEV